MSALNRRDFLRLSAGAVAAPWIHGAFPSHAFAADLTPKKLVSNGPPGKRINFVFLPEGFTSADEKAFDTFVKTVLTKGFSDWPAYKEIFPFINFSSVWAPSPAGFKGDGTGAFGVKLDASKHPVDKDMAKIKPAVAAAGADTWAIVMNDPYTSGYSGVREVIAPTMLNLFMHEMGHGFGQGDEHHDTGFANHPFGDSGTLNVDRTATNPRWQKAIDAKVPGVKTSLIPGTKDCYKGEDALCLMGCKAEQMPKGAPLGPLCTLGIYLNARKWIGGVIEEASPDELQKLKKGVIPKIDIKVIPSASFIPKAEAWWCAGTHEEMNETAKKYLLERKFEASLFSDQNKFRKLDLAYDKKERRYTAKAAVPPGSNTIIVWVHDPNPAIFTDPEGVCEARRIYRVDVE